jgi:signal transduction histidine kinase
METDRPRQHLLLTFAEPELETEYLSRQYEQGRSRMRMNVVFTSLILGVFGFVDPLLLPPPLLDSFRAIRLSVLLPLSVSLLIPLAVVHEARHWCRIAAVSVLLFGSTWTAMLVMGGTDVLGYLTLALNQTIVGTFFLLGLPVALSIPVVTIFTMLFVVALLIISPSLDNLLVHSLGCSVIAIITGFGAFRAESAARHQFVAEAAAHVHYSKRVTAETDRNRWLEVIASFLSHELHNAMVRIGSSVELALREKQSDRTIEVLDRARQSVSFMHTLLAHVADATQIETALAVQEVDTLSFSSLVADLVEDFQRSSPRWRVNSCIAPSVLVEGNEDRLIQMLDKLFDNARDHGDESYPLEVDLRIECDVAVLSIGNRGAALSADTEQMFQPFVSTKRGHSVGKNLGLGLFVARAIAVGHRGSIAAASLLDPPGACFTVRIPIAQRGTQR